MVCNLHKAGGHCTLAEIDREWSYADLIDAHRVIDAYEAATEELERKRGT